MAYLLHHLLRNTAKNHPENIAARYEKESITYRQLEQTSDQLAFALLHAGVERGDRIGIYLDKSIEAVMAIFAILKSGAVYIPLDTNAPAQRIATICKDAQAKILIGTQQSIEALGTEALDEMSRVTHVILVDKESESFTTHAWTKKTLSWSDVLQCSAMPGPMMIEHDLAYILYTSGSTGTPKGVMISHRASLTFINWACATFKMTSDDVVSSHAPFYFDLSIFDIFATIKAGATIVLLSKDASLFPINLAKIISEEKITIWYSVPSILTKLVLYGKLERYNFSHLRTILFAGEVFPVKYLQQLMNAIPNAAYYNLYGPTETNVCTYYKVPVLDAERTVPLSIGKSCENSEIIILDKHNQPVAKGEEGELCVRGPGLMTGYWNAPEKTAQVLNLLTLHAALGPEVVYRTGDFVKQNLDGDYEYLGRRDSMIKSRGYRIELAEIESVLYSHPDIEKTTVIAIPDEENSNIIKAFVVANDKKSVTPLMERDLKSFCSNRLPRYMIPQIFEFRDTLPHTSTGKIDNHQLKQESAQ